MNDIQISRKLPIAFAALAVTAAIVTGGTADVAKNIETVTRAAAESGEAAQNILAASDGLTNQSGILNDQVETFLKEVRAQ